MLRWNSASWTAGSRKTIFAKNSSSWATRIAIIALLAEGTPRIDKVVTVPSTIPIAAKQIQNLNGAKVSMARSFHLSADGWVPTALSDIPNAFRTRL
jgi:hypothetical protein